MRSTRRNTADEGGSLDLLLDTITNTFGGVLFMALLISVLLRISGSGEGDAQPPLPSAEEIREWTERLAAAELELQTLQAAFAIQERQRQRFESQQAREQFARLVEMREQRDELLRRKNELLQATGALQAEINEVAGQIEESAKQREEAAEDLAAAEYEWMRELSARQRTMEYPRLRTTHKREVPLVYRYGRLYFPYHYGSAVWDRRANLDEFVVTGQLQRRPLLTPKPYAGTPADAEGRLRDVLANRLQRLPPQSTYLAVAVWEDSFHQFGVLRQAMVDAGYEYRILPMRFGGIVSEVPTSERPKVQ